MPNNVPTSLTDAIEEIDECILSSDTLANPKAREALRSHIDRWVNALEAYETLEREENDDMGKRQPINHKQNPVERMRHPDRGTNQLSKYAY